MRVGSTELAKILGISRQRVNELGRLGKITRNADNSWDVETVARQLGRNLNQQQQAKARVPIPSTSRTRQEEAALEREPIITGGSSHEIFNRARAAKELAIAKERQLDLKRREGQLLEIADVERTWTAGLTAIKNRLLLVPDRLAARLAACQDVLECREIIHGEVVRVLEVLTETRIDDDAA